MPFVYGMFVPTLYFASSLSTTMIGIVDKMFVVEESASA